MATEPLAIDGDHERLTTFAATHPREYERRVLLMALLGYVYLVVALVVVLGLIAGLALFLWWWRSEGHPTGLFVGLWIALGAMFVRIVQAFTFTPPAPKGIRLAREESPALFSLIDELVVAERTPRVDDVLLSPDVDAACVQIARFGVFGPTRRYLVLGARTLLSCSPDELRAVLAHELGHLSTNGGRRAAWLYGVRETWSRLLVSLDEHQSLFSGLFGAICGRYMGAFARYSFVLARQHEIDSDRFAAKLSGARVVADALVRMAVVQRAVQRQADRHVGAQWLETSGPVAQFRALIKSPVDDAQQQRDLRGVLAEPNPEGDPHPSLAERLRGLGVEARVLDAPAESAAQRYLGHELDALCARLDELWRDALAAAQGPSGIANALAAPKAELAKLEAVALEGSATADLRRRAQLTEMLRGADAALVVYEELARRDDAIGHLGLGRSRLGRGDPSGLASLDRAIELDTEIGLAAATIARDFLVTDGRSAEAERYGEIADKRVEELTEKFVERAQLSDKDELAPHDLSEAVVARVVEIVARVKPISRAYLVKKVVPDRTDVPAYFLAVVCANGWFYTNERRDHYELMQRLQDAVGEISTDITVAIVNRFTGRKGIEAVPGSLVYTRPPVPVGRDVVPIWGRRAQKLAFALAVPYVLIYVWLVVNLEPQYNKLSGPIILVPMFAAVGALFWSLRGDTGVHRQVGLAGLGGFIGLVLGAFVAEEEWTVVFVPVLALGLLRPPADVSRARAGLVVAVGAAAGLASRVIAHFVLMG